MFFTSAAVKEKKNLNFTLDEFIESKIEGYENKII